MFAQPRDALFFEFRDRGLQSSELGVTRSGFRADAGVPVCDYPVARFMGCAADAGLRCAGLAFVSRPSVRLDLPASRRSIASRSFFSVAGLTVVTSAPAG